MNPHSNAKLFGLLAAIVLGGWLFPGCTETTTVDETVDSTQVETDSLEVEVPVSTNPLVGKWVPDGTPMAIMSGSDKIEISNEGNWMEFSDSTYAMGGILGNGETQPYTLSEDDKKVNLVGKGHYINIIELDEQKIKLMYFSEGQVVAMTLKKEQ